MAEFAHVFDSDVPFDGEHESDDMLDCLLNPFEVNGVGMDAGNVISGAGTDELPFDIMDIEPSLGNVPNSSSGNSNNSVVFDRTSRGSSSCSTDAISVSTSVASVIADAHETKRPNVRSRAQPPAAGMALGPLVDVDVGPAGIEELAPIRAADGQLLSFENFQGKIDISKCVKMSLNSLNLGDADVFDETGSGPTMGAGGGASAEKKKRPRKPNPDSELISQATEQTLALMNLDPNSKEGKKQRRRIRNQMSAQLHRERKKQYIEALEQCIRERDVQIRALEAQVLRLSHSHGHGQAVQSYAGCSVSSAARSTGDGESDCESWVTESSSTSPAHEPCYAPSQTTIQASELPARKLRRTSVFVESESESNSSSGEVDSSGHRLKRGLTLFSTALLGLSLMSLKSPVESSVGANAGGAIHPTSYDAGHIVGPLSASEAVGAAQLDEVASTALASSPVLFLPKLSSGETKSTSVSSPRPVVAYERSWHDTDAHTTSLWEYADQDAVAQLFPPHVNATASAPIRATSPDSRKSKRHLRAGGLRAKELASERALVSVTRPWPDSRAGRGGGTEGDEATSVSRVLMTQGRALLDRSFLDSPHVFKIKGEGVGIGVSQESTDTAASSWDMSALTSWTGKQSGAGPVVAITTGTSATPGSAETDGALAAPQLVMMLPASAIRWGSSWGDGAARDDSFESILRDLNDTTESDQAERMDGRGARDSSDLWVEIGCSVFKAQLVKNVNTAI